MEGENALNGFEGIRLWRQCVTIAEVRHTLIQINVRDPTVCGLSSLGWTRLCSHFHRLRHGNKTDRE